MFDTSCSNFWCFIDRDDVTTLIDINSTSRNIYATCKKINISCEIVLPINFGKIDTLQVGFRWLDASVSDTWLAASRPLFCSQALVFSRTNTENDATRTRCESPCKTANWYVATATPLYKLRRHRVGIQNALWPLAHHPLQYSRLR